MRGRTLRSIRNGCMLAAFASVGLAAAPAHANEFSSRGPNSSVGSASLRYEEYKGLPTTIETGFVGPDWGKINVGLRLEPVVNGGPLYSVDMPRGAQIEASWGTDRRVLLRPMIGSQIDGLVTVRHTLAPSVELAFNVAGLAGSFRYDATQLLSKLPGSKFAYDSGKIIQPFAPWGFTPVETPTNVYAMDSSKAVILSMSMEKLPDFIAENVVGTFGLRAVNVPRFSYRTTRIFISGAPGEITSATGEVSLPAVDGDYMDVMTAVDGEMTVNGSITVEPYIDITSIKGTAFGLEFGIPIVKPIAYSTPNTRIPFQAVLVHIPMPNVHVPNRGVDLGYVNAGQRTTRRVEIDNSGEKEAVMTFKSSDGQFDVPSREVMIPPRSRYEIEIGFSSQSAEPASAEITVNSSDADSPEQHFRVGANGADVGQGSNPNAGDDGCGCKAAGTTSSLPTWAGFGLLGAGAIVLARRRRKN